MRQPSYTMNSKTVLFLCCVLATALVLVKCDDSSPQQHPRATRSNLRYKRMYVMCPPKFSRIGNECYYISPNKLNWLDAYFECKDHNSKLAEPLKFEDKHLRRYLQKIQHHDDLWIGGTFNWKLNKWQWGHNGREMEYQSFSQMVPGSSRDLKYNCALLRAEQKFRWSADECTKKVNFICQHRMPLVSEFNRDQVYYRWNETYPNQQANEKLVYIVSDPNNRTRNDPGRVRIYNSMKQVFRSNPSIQPRPAHRRNPGRGRKHSTQAASGNNRTAEYIPSDVVYRRQQIAQYAPDAHNELNGLDNGHSPHRNGHATPRFNVNLGYGRNRDPSFAHGSHRTGQARLPQRNQPHPYPHQHRHQAGTYNEPSRKTTKHMHPFYMARPTPPTTTTTTMRTTTTPASFTTHRPTTSTIPVTPEQEYYETTYEPPTRKPVYIPPLTTTPAGPKRVSAAEEKRLQREALRARLNRLTPEEREFFFQDRARRKRLKEQEQLRKLQQQQQQDNEVV